MANHLYKKIQFLEDSPGDRHELNYIRDRNTKHEVDFVILKNRKPEIIIEVKTSDLVRSKSLYYFKEKLKVNKAIQLVMQETKTNTKDGIVVANVSEWLSRKLDLDF